MTTIKIAGVKLPVPIPHIMYIIGNGNYSDVYTENGKHIMTSMSLIALERQSSDLLRIHKSALVNPDFIEKVTFVVSAKQLKEAPITMRDGKILPISRRRYEVLLHILKRADV